MACNTSSWFVIDVSSTSSSMPRLQVLRLLGTLLPCAPFSMSTNSKKAFLVALYYMSLSFAPTVVIKEVVFRKISLQSLLSF